MTALYAVILIVSFLALVGWVVRRGLSDSADRGFDRLPALIAAAMAFGLAGLSAAYGGWPLAANIGAAVAGAVVATVWVRATRVKEP